MEQNRLLSVQEAAQYLGVAVKTVYKWNSERRLRCIKLGSLVRYKISDLDEYIRQNIVEPAAR